MLTCSTQLRGWKRKSFEHAHFGFLPLLWIVDLCRFHAWHEEMNHEKGK
jgi:hypothetical protein